MRKTILTILGSALMASSIAQAASAAEHHRSHMAGHFPAQTTERMRGSNAFYPPEAVYVPTQAGNYANYSGAGR